METYTVNIWASEPHENENDILTGEDFTDRKQAVEVYYHPEKFFVEFFAEITDPDLWVEINGGDVEDHYRQILNYRRILKEGNWL